MYNKFSESSQVLKFSSIAGAGEMIFSSLVSFLLQQSQLITVLYFIMLVVFEIWLVSLPSSVVSLYLLFSHLALLR